MSCRRICRELLWLSRFGEFGPSSQPHLDHLAGCRGCRDEVGFDRAMVERLRIALAERIEGAAPSPRAFELILARAQHPEPAPAVRIWEWSTAVLGKLRFATAMAGTGLALLLALNMDVVSIATPSSDAAPAPETAVLQQVPRVPPAPNPLAEIVAAWGGGAGSSATHTQTQQILTTGPAPQERIAPEPATATERTLRIVVRPMQTPDPGSAAIVAGPTGSDESPGGADMPAGQPS
jgi:hypothetical protein